METTRQRNSAEVAFRGQYRGYYRGAPAGSTSYNDSLTGRQTTVSEGHRVSTLGDYDIRSGRYNDVGGPFTTSKETYRDLSIGPFNLYRGDPKSFEYFYSGNLRPTSVGSAYGSFSPGSWFPGLGRSSDDLLAQLGTTAIARTIPTNPVADASTFIGELREGLPSLVGSQLFKGRKPLKSSGSEYLNWQFGIMPMIGDFQKFARAYSNSGRILAQLRRDSGRIVRRRYSFPEEETVLESVKTGNTYPAPTFNSVLYSGSGVTHVETKLTRKRWFSGAYTYYLPKEDDFLGRYRRFEAEANKLLGTRVTPEMFWNLTPWSWAVDWFSNTGDVFHNLSAFANDGLVLRYGYMMEEITITQSRSWVGQLFIGNSPTVVYVADELCKTYKTRRQATPFGFGLTWSGLTPRQLAIAAALGISRH